MDESNKNLGFYEYLNRVIGEEGAQVKVTANIAPENFVYMGVAVLSGVVLGNIINLVITKLLK